MNYLISEADIREKVISPWLKAIGISLDRVIMEQKFTIQLGHGIYEVNSERQRESAYGRADYLVKNTSGINLFVVEAKNSSQAITYEDRDQAISYARLIIDENIPPFAIVTNGINTIIYDVISKEEIISLDKFSDHSYVKGEFKVCCGIDYKAEALQYLLSLNADNLLTFCKGQVEYRMQSLKSTDIFSGKKYIPQLYCERWDAKNKLNKILFDKDNSKQIALVIGKPQHGKTSFLCNTVETLINSNTPCLFYPAIGLKSGLFHAIQEDFLWAFNNELSPFHIVKQLQSILNKVGLSMVLIIDGLNEIDVQNALYINQECSRLSYKELKLIVSATSNSLQRILFEVDNPTFISSKVNLTSKDAEILKVKELKNIEKKDIIQIGNFSKSEVEEAVDKYKKAYSVNVETLDKVLSNPFYLGRAMELYAGNKLPITLNTKELISECLYKKGKRASKEVIELKTELCKISNLLFENDAPLSELHKLDINAESISKLCDAAIITEVHDENGCYGIDFYYSSERDYVVSYELRKWDKVFLENEELIIKELDFAFNTNVGKEALRWFFSYPMNITHLKHTYKHTHDKIIYNDLFCFAIFNQNFEKKEDLTWLKMVLENLIKDRFLTEPYDPKEKALLMYKILESLNINPDFVSSNQLYLIKELLLYEISIEDHYLYESFSYSLLDKGLEEIYISFFLDNDQRVVEASALLVAHDYQGKFIEVLNFLISKQNSCFLNNKNCFIKALNFISDNAWDPMCPDIFSEERDVEEWIGILEEYKNDFDRILTFYQDTNVCTYFREVIVAIQDEIMDQCNKNPSVYEEYKEIISNFHKNTQTLNDPSQLKLPFDNREK